MEDAQFWRNYSYLSQIKGKHEPNEAFIKPVDIEVPGEEGYCENTVKSHGDISAALFCNVFGMRCIAII